LILAFDTSAAYCAAALMSGDSLVAGRREEMSRGQAERLFPMLGEILDDRGIDWQALDAIAVGTGPGNFTGLRVAIAAARGLALSTGLPAIGIDGFLARVVGAQRPALVCIAAPRGMLHVRRFGPGLDHHVETVAEGAARNIASDEGLTLVGDAVGVPPALPLVEAIGRVAHRKLRAGDPPARPTPFYVRPADAAPGRSASPTLLP
jgi:tRNA threonylcarbamoyladenosine biosynthesis protein TsaB